VQKGIENLARNRQKPHYPEAMSSRMTDIKRSDFDSADFDEILKLTRQVRPFLEEKDKQKQQEITNKKRNNPRLFTSYRCSTDRNGGWQN